MALQPNCLLYFLELIQKYPCHHDIRSYSNATNRKIGVEFEWTPSFQNLHDTIKRTAIRVISTGIWLQFLYPGLHIIERKQAAAKNPETALALAGKKGFIKLKVPL